MAATKIKGLLHWCRRTTQGYEHVQVENFTTSWKNGLAFCAIIHRFRPDLIDYDSLLPENVFENCKMVFQIAEEELDIPAFLDARDMARLKAPDKLSVITYVSEYYNALSSLPELGGPGVRVKVTNQVTTSTEKALEADDQKAPIRKASHTEAAEDTCSICQKRVYLLERHQDKEKLYHRACFRHSELSPTNKVYTSSPYFSPTLTKEAAVFTFPGSPVTETDKRDVKQPSSLTTPSRELRSTCKGTEEITPKYNEQNRKELLSKLQSLEGEKYKDKVSAIRDKLQSLKNKYSTGKPSENILPLSGKEARQLERKREGDSLVSRELQQLKKKQDEILSSKKFKEDHTKSGKEDLPFNRHQKSTMLQQSNTGASVPTLPSSLGVSKSSLSVSASQSSDPDFRRNTAKSELVNIKANNRNSSAASVLPRANLDCTDSTNRPYPVPRPRSSVYPRSSEYLTSAGDFKATNKNIGDLHNVILPRKLNQNNSELHNTTPCPELETKNEDINDLHNIISTSELEAANHISSDLHNLTPSPKLETIENSSDLHSVTLSSEFITTNENSSGLRDIIPSPDIGMIENSSDLDNITPTSELKTTSENSDLYNITLSPELKQTYEDIRDSHNVTPSSELKATNEDGSDLYNITPSSDLNTTIENCSDLHNITPSFKLETTNENSQNQSLVPDVHKIGTEIAKQCADTSQSSPTSELFPTAVIQNVHIPTADSSYIKTDLMEPQQTGTADIGLRKSERLELDLSSSQFSCTTERSGEKTETVGSDSKLEVHNAESCGLESSDFVDDKNKGLNCNHSKTREANTDLNKEKSGANLEKEEADVYKDDAGVDFNDSEPQEEKINITKEDFSNARIRVSSSLYSEFKIVDNIISNTTTDGDNNISNTTTDDDKTISNTTTNNDNNISNTTTDNNIISNTTTNDIIISITTTNDDNNNHDEEKIKNKLYGNDNDDPNHDINGANYFNVLENSGGTNITGLPQHAGDGVIEECEKEERCDYHHIGSQIAPIKLPRRLIKSQHDPLSTIGHTRRNEQITYSESTKSGTNTEMSLDVKADGAGTNTAMSLDVKADGAGTNTAMSVGVKADEAGINTAMSLDVKADGAESSVPQWKKDIEERRKKLRDDVARCETEKVDLKYLREKRTRKENQDLELGKGIDVGGNQSVTKKSQLTDDKGRPERGSKSDVVSGKLGYVDDVRSDKKPVTDIASAKYAEGNIISKNSEIVQPDSFSQIEVSDGEVRVSDEKPLGQHNILQPTVAGNESFESSSGLVTGLGLSDLIQSETAKMENSNTSETTVVVHTGKQISLEGNQQPPKVRRKITVIGTKCQRESSPPSPPARKKIEAVKHTDFEESSDFERSSDSEHSLQATTKRPTRSDGKQPPPRPPPPSLSDGRQPPPRPPPPISLSTTTDQSEQPHPLSAIELQQQLLDIDGRLTNLELRGRNLEESIRNDTTLEEGDDSLLTEWFTLVIERNELVRREQDLAYISKQQELEDEQEHIERQLRYLLNKTDKTYREMEEEGYLIDQKLKLVKRRSQIIESMEEDRMRYESEDKDLQRWREQGVCCPLVQKKLSKSKFYS